MFSFMNNSNGDYEKKFFDFSIKDIDNKNLDLSVYKGKIILLVNVASNCGFTKQYTDLQNLYDNYPEIIHNASPLTQNNLFNYNAGCINRGHT